MPRRNENARPRQHVANDRWRAADLKAISEYVDRKASESKSHSTIKTTPEQIVRDFRRENIIPMMPISKIRERRVGLPWWKKVNWQFVSDVGCWMALIACLAILSIFFFIPFAIKLFEPVISALR